MCDGSYKRNPTSPETDPLLSSSRGVRICDESRFSRRLELYLETVVSDCDFTISMALSMVISLPV